MADGVGAGRRAVHTPFLRRMPLRRAISVRAFRSLLAHACSKSVRDRYVVSPWMVNGTALEYVKKYPNDVNRLNLVSFISLFPSMFTMTSDHRFVWQIRRIAEGLKLLHGQDPPIAHGDLKAVRSDRVSLHHSVLWKLMDRPFARPMCSSIASGTRGSAISACRRSVFKSRWRGERADEFVTSRSWKT